MNHHMNVIIETEVLGKKGTKKKIQSTMRVEDILVEKYQNGGMKLASYKIPFKSFVKNFGTTLSYIMGSATTTGVNTANGASQAASTFMSVSEAAINNSTNSIHSRRGLYIGDNLENTVAAASTALVSASTSKSFLTGAVGSKTSKNDTFIGRRIEASSASVATKVSYGAMSITISTDDRVTLKRRFYNSRGSAITIGEIGLGTQNVISAGYFVDHNILLARDVTSRPFDLEDQQYLDITMEFSIPTTGYLTTNFVVMLANIFKNNDGAYNYKNVNGTIPTGITTFTVGTDVKAGADDVNRGLQLGSRFDNFSIYDYKLLSIIGNATLDRSATTFINDLNTYNTTTRFGFQRDFTNVGTSKLEIAEGSLQIKDDSDDGIVIARFPTGEIDLDPNDILRVKFYFDFPVSAGGLTEA